MTKNTARLVSVEIRDAIAILTIDNPPVNAWSHPVRQQLSQALATLEADRAIGAIILRCAGKTFSVGADVQELGRPPIPPAMGEVMRQMEALETLLIAAIHGQALGGGLEVALICDYRVATADAKFGLPEIKLGLMPGGGGTQRLPRLIGAAPALDMILSGKPIGTQAARAQGLLDRVADGELLDEAVDFATELLTTNAAKRRLSQLPVPANEIDFPQARAKALQDARGLTAAGAAVEAIAAAQNLPFAQGLECEAELFQHCRTSPESAALRHLFAGEREVAKIPLLQAGVQPRMVNRVAVVGAGTMGAGVAISLLDAGYPVTLIDTTEPALQRGASNITASYDALVKRKRISAGQRDESLARLHPTLNLDAVRESDLVIECVFEDLAVKQDLFVKLGPLLRPAAILATNTSALDVNAIAAASGRPADVVGMHFFSPANIMRLVEVVNAKDTAPDVLATAMAVAKRIGKIGIVSGVCDGFIGNRMIGGYLRQANLLLFEGARPEQIDHALVQFGMAMGPHTMGDMAGLDIQAAARQRRRAEGRLSKDDYFGAIADRLVAAGRLGLKSGQGMYRYEPGSRTPLPDAAVSEIITQEAAKREIPQKHFADDEIIARCVLPLVNEGARILAEKIAFGAVDIDVLYCNGYGFPRSRGGPMFYADTIGLPTVLSQIEHFCETFGPRDWTAAPLLTQLAAEGKRFSSLARGEI